MKSRGPEFVAGGGLIMAVSAVLSGAGIVLTPATGPPGVRFGAFGNLAVEVLVAVGGVTGGLALALTTVWLAARLLDGRRAGSALTMNSATICLFAAAATAGLWIFGRADPPLPPSWNWIRIPLWTGFLGTGTWLGGLIWHRRQARKAPSEGIPRV